MYEKKPFDRSQYEKYLEHENINNLAGLEIDLVYEWEEGSMLIFDRTRLHCSSCIIDGKKIGLTTFTKKQFLLNVKKQIIKYIKKFNEINSSFNF